MLKRLCSMLSRTSVKHENITCDEEHKDIEYSSDIPLFEKNLDRFSRWGFAERIGQVISMRSDPNSIVIGLYGEWGSGKTSVLNFIEKSLESEKNVICITFNPWRYGSEDELLLGFFLDITKALDIELFTDEEKAMSGYEKVAPLMEKIPLLNAAGFILANLIPKPDIKQLKARVEKKLKTEQKRVVVFIDDIDRLEKTEIHALFRLVKLTADFKYTAYILAFDKDIIAASLQERYSASSGSGGEEFLEKIIQIPLHLPAIRQQELSSWCLVRIEEVLRTEGIELSQQQIYEFHFGYTKALESCISTPRKMNRYTNALLFSLPILKGEINPVDLMLIEGIRIFCPSLYQTIQTNQGIFAGIFSEDHLSADYKANIKKIVDDALNSETNINSDGWIELLQHMFPKLEQVYGFRSYHDSISNEWRKEQRICSDDYFLRYFTFSIPKEEISDNAVQNLFHISEKWAKPFDPQYNSLNQLLTTSTAAALLYKLRNKSNEANPDASVGLAIAVSQKSNIIPNYETLFQSTTPFANAGMLVSDLIQNLDKSQRVELVKMCIDHASCIEFMVEVFKWLRREDNSHPEKDGFATSCINDIGNHLGNSLSKNLKECEDITHIKLWYIPEILYRLNEFVNTNFATDYVADLISRKPESLSMIIGSYIPKKYTAGGGIKENLEQNGYSNLTNLLNTEMLYDAIHAHFPAAIKQYDKFPSADEDDADRALRLVEQYVWYYQRKDESTNQEDTNYTESALSDKLSNPSFIE